MIDSELQKELRLRFNPDGSELRRAQLRMLEMLKYIDQICEENCINYWLSSGTCLGAVRHGGFIPWDDDVDIEMTSSDRKKFIEIVNNRNDEFKVQHCNNDSTFFGMYVKLRDTKSETLDSTNKSTIFKGLYIDIFIMCTGTMATRIIAGGLRNLLVFSLDHFSFGKPSIVRNIASKLRIFNSKLLTKCVYPFLKFIEKPFSNKNILRHDMGITFLKSRRTSEIFPLRKIDFEGIKLNVPGNVDAYLTRIYGDYMKMPEVDEIHPHYTKVTFF